MEGVYFVPKMFYYSVIRRGRGVCYTAHVEQDQQTSVFILQCKTFCLIPALPQSVARLMMELEHIAPVYLATMDHPVKGVFHAAR